MDSDGESSECPEFDMGEVTDGEDDAETQSTTLVLPPGWHVRRFQRGTRAGREFVDPSGNVYRTEAQARKVVDEIRRAANLASRWDARLGAKLRALEQKRLQEASSMPEPSQAGTSPSPLMVDAVFGREELAIAALDPPLSAEVAEVNATDSLDGDFTPSSGTLGGLVSKVADDATASANRLDVDGIMPAAAIFAHSHQTSEDVASEKVVSSDESPRSDSGPMAVSDLTSEELPVVAEDSNQLADDLAEVAVGAEDTSDGSKRVLKRSETIA
jgi:hypothetical protein